MNNNININEVYNAAKYWENELRKFPNYQTNDPQLEYNRNYALNELNVCNRILEQYNTQRSFNIPVYNQQQNPTPGVGFGVSQKPTVALQTASITAQHFGAMNTSEQIVGSSNSRYANTNRAQIQTPPQEQQVTIPNAITVDDQMNNTQLSSKKYMEDSDLELVIPKGAKIYEIENKIGFIDKVVELPNSEFCNVKMHNRIEKLESDNQIDDVTNKYINNDVIPITINREYIVKTKNEITDEDKQIIKTCLENFKNINGNSQFTTLCSKISTILPNFVNFLNNILLDKFNNTLKNCLDLNIFIDDIVNDFTELECANDIFNANYLKSKPHEYYIQFLRESICNIISDLDFAITGNSVKFIYKEPAILLSNDIINNDNDGQLYLRPDSFPKLFTCVKKCIDILGEKQTRLGVKIISYSDKTSRYNKIFEVYDVKYSRLPRYLLNKIS